MKVIISLVGFLILAVMSEMTSASEQENAFAKYFLVNEVKIIESLNQSDLMIARYREEGPMVILEIAKSKTRIFYYAEISDLGGTLFSATPSAQDIRIIRQSHAMTCQDINNALIGESLFRSACNLSR